MKKNIGIWLVRSEAESIAAKLSDQFGGTVYRPWTIEDQSQKTYFRSVFSEQEAWILIMACGIAVRFIDGLLQDKWSDPAVVVLDEGCRNVIALAGGHEGGANELAFAVGNFLGANPIITTATEALKPLVIGVGCRKGVTVEEIEAAVQAALGDRLMAEVREVATIDLKKDEPGLNEFCLTNKIPLRWFTTEDVASRAWVGKTSTWVLENVGVEGVCEPCALMANARGRLWRGKTSLNGVSVAIAEDQQENKVKDAVGAL